MRRLLAGFAIWTAIWFMMPAGVSYSDLKDDVGFTRLSEELGENLPSADGVMAAHVEAPIDDNWMPDVSNTQFTGKTITDKTGGSSGSSGHATGVGKLFYGNSSSLTPGIGFIDAYSASSWLGSAYLLLGAAIDDAPIQPMFYINPYNVYDHVLSAPARVGNHSWVGTSDYSGEVLRRLDFVIQADEFVQVVGISNGSTPTPLLGDAFNAISVGCTDGGHPMGTSNLDTTYAEGRQCPLIVIPLDTTSSSTPVIASAAALLVHTGRTTDMGSDPVQTAVTNRSGSSILNAERAETIKAALLAGAGRITYNSTEDQITDYRRESANQSANGLDIRFGAGQLNIYTSYHIVAAGEQNSAEDDPANSGNIARNGFDLDPFFGGLSGSNSVGTYRFTAGADDRRLYSSLVWHLKIDGGTWYDFNDTATLYNLDLWLYDTSAENGDRLVASSADTDGNTENLWTAIVPGRSYRIEVTVGEGPSAFLWDYALAWRMGSPPDSDGDGMDDEWEVQYGLDYTSADDVPIDNDGDGLGALLEYRNGTDPHDSDTDGDSVRDGIEVSGGTDPLNAADFPLSVNAASATSLVVILLCLIGIAIPASHKCSRRYKE